MDPRWKHLTLQSIAQKSNLKRKSSNEMKSSPNKLPKVSTDCLTKLGLNYKGKPINDITSPKQCYNRIDKKKQIICDAMTKILDELNLTDEGNMEMVIQLSQFSSVADTKFTVRLNTSINGTSINEITNDDYGRIEHPSIDSKQDYVFRKKIGITTSQWDSVVIRTEESERRKQENNSIEPNRIFLQRDDQNELADHIYNLLVNCKPFVEERGGAPYYLSVLQCDILHYLKIWGNLEVFNLQGQERMNCKMNGLWDLTPRFGGKLTDFPEFQHINPCKGFVKGNKISEGILMCLINYMYQDLNDDDLDDVEHVVD